jgi:hypothetical protein
MHNYCMVTHNQKGPKHDNLWKSISGESGEFFRNILDHCTQLEKLTITRATSPYTKCKIKPCSTNNINHAIKELNFIDTSITDDVLKNISIMLPNLKKLKLDFRGTKSSSLLPKMKTTIQMRETAFEELYILVEKDLLIYSFDGGRLYVRFLMDSGKEKVYLWEKQLPPVYNFQQQQVFWFPQQQQQRKEEKQEQPPKLQEAERIKLETNDQRYKEIDDSKYTIIYNVVQWSSSSWMCTIFVLKLPYNFAVAPLFDPC